MKFYTIGATVGNTGCFGGNGYIFDLDCDNGFVGAHVGKNLSHCPLSMRQFIVCQFYFRKVDFKRRYLIY
jgi:hypothetical protein